MPEGSVICVMLALVLSSAMGMIVYCLQLARKYKRIEADMRCVYAGEVHQIDEILFNRNDWFLRKVRFHTNCYPYVVEVLIAEVDPV